MSINNQLLRGWDKTQPLTEKTVEGYRQVNSHCFLVEKNKKILNSSDSIICEVGFIPAAFLMQKLPIRLTLR